MEVKIAGCPLGAKCEEVKEKDGAMVLYRCPWYVRVSGTDNNTGKEMDHWGCAIAWMPTLMVNAANESRKGVSATESFRNEMVQQSAQTQNIMRVTAQIEQQREALLAVQIRASEQNQPIER